MIKEKYMEVATMIQTDIDHIEFHLSRETEPREIAHLRKLSRELKDKRNAIIEAIHSME